MLIMYANKIYAILVFIFSKFPNEFTFKGLKMGHKY